MDTSKARELLSILADGIDPFTGEILPEDHVCNEPDMIRALHLAVQHLEMSKQVLLDLAQRMQGSLGQRKMIVFYAKCLSGDASVKK